MRKFKDILAIARKRHGEQAMHGYNGPANPKNMAQLALIPDDRYLAMATRCIFHAGFNWQVIDAKWDGFEEAFEDFAIPRWAMANDDDVARLVSDKRIVRNGQKIASVPENARFFAGISEKNGGVGLWLGQWPVSDYVGLLAELAEGGSRLGGTTGQYFLRFMGKDSFILSKDVVAALIREGVIDKPSASKKAMAAIQDAFNRWMEESGQSMTAISQTLARSIDA
jgi:3-methyladenine DNA glycosylase Tag